MDLRLSEKAYRLLIENKIAELQALPIEGLIHPTDHEKLIAEALTIEQPVVISSGYIVSKQSLDSQASSDQWICPVTKMSLSCLPPSEEIWYIPLPVIADAISSSEKVVIKHTDVQLKILVSGNKFRMDMIALRSPFSSEDRETMEKVITRYNSLYPDTIPCRIAHGAYALAGNSRGYDIADNGKAVRIDFWFTRGQIIDTDVQEVLSDISSKLFGEQAMEIEAEPLPECSITTLGHRQYIEVISTQIQDMPTVINSCRFFVDAVTALAARLDMVLTDRMSGNPTRAIEDKTTFPGRFFSATPPQIPQPETSRYITQATTSTQSGVVTCMGL